MLKAVLSGIGSENEKQAGSLCAAQNVLLLCWGRGKCEHFTSYKMLTLLCVYSYFPAVLQDQNAAVPNNMHLYC